MTDGIGEDPEARLTLASDASGAQGEQFLLCLVGITHTNVQMQLLRIRRVRPARSATMLAVVAARLLEVFPLFMEVVVVGCGWQVVLSLLHIDAARVDPLVAAGDRTG
jgi:hypothetical protein